MTDLAPGTRFAGCRIVGVAGRGGMGVVYSAVEERLDRPVALKLIAHQHAADREFRDRFERESRLAASIDHPNVVPIYAAGEEGDRPFLVMRLVRGTDLQALLKERGALDLGLATKLVAQVASALDAAHAAGLVHRDVKPANVLLDGDHVYLTDFGLTRLAGSETQLTETGRWMGTVDFASPGAAAGRPHRRPLGRLRARLRPLRRHRRAPALRARDGSRPPCTRTSTRTSRARARRSTGCCAARSPRTPPTATRPRATSAARRWRPRAASTSRRRSAPSPSAPPRPTPTPTR